MSSSISASRKPMAEAGASVLATSAIAKVNAKAI
jgi:hypothetical protein